MEAIREEAAQLVKHRRRGFADLVTVLLEYGWEAYLRGDLDVELRPAAVSLRIARAE